MVFHVVSDEGRDHGDQAARENENGEATKVFVDFGENVALNPEHQGNKGNHLNHMVEVFFAGKGKRDGLTHAFLSESRKKT